MRKFLWVLAILCLSFTFMAGTWTLDVSSGALASEGGEFINLLGIQDPFVSFHVGLWMSIVSFFVLSIITAYLVLEVRRG